MMAAWASMYFFTRFGFQSGGILAALTLGLGIKELWRRSCPRCLASQVRYDYLRDSYSTS